MPHRTSALARRATTVAAVALLAAGLSGCRSAPSEAEIAGAESARPSAQGLIDRMEIAEPTGYALAAARTMDACGSQTSDRGGLDDAHLEGYSCVIVRRSVFVPSESPEHADAAEWTAVAEIQEAFGLTLGDMVPSAIGHVEVDGSPGSVDVIVRPADGVDLDMLPVWHANQVVHSDDGEVETRLGEIATPETRVLQVTVTIRYFEMRRQDG